VVGDRDGNGTVTVGVVDPATMTWYLRNENSAGAPDAGPFPFGAPGWRPVVGDWNGDGTTTVGAAAPNGTWYLRNSNSAGGPDYTPFAYGSGGWVPLAFTWGAPPLHLLGAGGEGPGSIPLSDDQLMTDILATGPRRTGALDAVFASGL
jgi:hypothetical protein